MKELDRKNIMRFWEGRAKVTGEESTRFHPEHLAYDLAALGPYCSPGIRLLELGCGRCTMINPLVENYGIRAHGVDMIPDFLDSAISHPLLTTEVGDAVTYQPKNTYDVVVFAGLLSCIPSSDDRSDIYRRISASLTSEGLLFIKSQFGRENDVSVDAWSEALGDHYTSFYPSIENELKLIRKTYDVHVSDCYPMELNPHQNTKFFHLFCRKRG